MYRWLIFNGWLTLCCVTALIRGGAPERIGAAIFLAATGLTVFVASPYETRFQHVERGILAVDLLLFLAFFALGYRANRIWPIWVSGLQLTAVFIHLGRALEDELPPNTYGQIVALWSYPLLGLLLMGTVRHRRRLTRLGEDPPWRRRF